MQDFLEEIPNDSVDVILKRMADAAILLSKVAEMNQIKSHALIPGLYLHVPELLREYVAHEYRADDEVESDIDKLNKMGLTMVQIWKIFSSSVVAPLDSDGFFQALTMLKEDFDFTIVQFTTFMSNGGVAARVEKEAFINALMALKDNLDLSTDQPTTFMSNSVAARIEKEAFINALRALKNNLGLSTDRLTTFMSDGVAARIEQEAFMKAVLELNTDMGLSNAQLVHGTWIEAIITRVSLATPPPQRPTRPEHPSFNETASYGGAGKCMNAGLSMASAKSCV